MACAGDAIEAKKSRTPAAIAYLLRNNGRSHWGSVVEETAEQVSSGAICGYRLRRTVGLQRATGEPARQGRSLLLQRAQSERRPARERRGIGNGGCGVREAVVIDEMNLRADRDRRDGGRKSAALTVRRLLRLVVCEADVDGDAAASP